MKKTSLLKSLPLRLLASVALGLLVGLFLHERDGSALSSLILHGAVTIRSLLSQPITFCVPLIILGFIAPAIAGMGQNASRILAAAFRLAYLSSVGAALFSMTAGYLIIPRLSISPAAESLKSIPDVVFQLSIPQIMPVMSALVLSVLLGLSAAWTKAILFSSLLREFQEMVLTLVSRVIVPLLPPFIAATFCTLAYEGTITGQLPLFFQAILLVILGHYLWLAILYLAAGLYSRTNPFLVLKNYGPAYLAAIGTMSSAATLALSLQCAKKSPTLREDVANLAIPLFANIHLCGSVLTEVFFVMAISRVTYGSIPSVGAMLLFCLLLGFFSIGAPGVPGGTVLASLGLITGILKFGDSGTALMLTIFALQDSFGTACSVTGNGALALILTGYANRHSLPSQDKGS
ncbi:MAG: cation:dicarboxylase symporter family transporter [Eubacteriales bacterium]|nr:cation:dicarboxylase symporter family transporter [Eubacteriales bacterium]